MPFEAALQKKRFIEEPEPQAEVEGSFCEWPCNPPIGQLTLEHRDEPGETEKLYALLQRRFGLSKEDVFKKFHKRGKVWSEAEMLRLALLSLDGRTNEEIAEAFDDVRDPEFFASSILIASMKYQYLSPLAKHVSEVNKRKTRQWHALLFPENPRTEHLLLEIEKALALSRQEIFNYGSRLPTSRGLYAIDNAIRILHYKIVYGFTDKLCAERARVFIEKDRHEQCVLENHVAILSSRLLSGKAKAAFRSVRGYKKQKQRNAEVVIPLFREGTA